MIENIRKYSGLMIVVFVIAAVAFIFGDYTRSAGHASAGGVPILKINGREYTDKNVEKTGDNSRELVMGLVQSGDYELYSFVMGMVGNASSEQQASETFFTRRILLREAREEFGIYPSNEKIADFIRGLKIFAGADGKFDQEKYNTFIEKGIGRLGMAESDLRDLASDILVFQTLKTIIGTGLTADRASILADSALDNQKITAEIARIAVAPFAEKVQPTEEDVKKFWETVQDSFTTEPRRKFTYVIITPSIPAPAAEEAPAALPENATQEQKDAAAKLAETKKSEREAATASAKRQEQLKVDDLVDQFLSDLEDKKGNGFEELAKKNGWEPKTTDFFTASAPPAELNVDLRASSRKGKAADVLFTLTQTPDPFSKISEALAVGENQWLVARLDAEEKTRPKTFEEAREQARTQYITEKAAEALKAATNEAATKIKESLAAGKSFADAAKEAGITDVAKLPEITRTYSPAPTEPPNLFQLLRTVDPGTIAEPVVGNTNGSILFVEKRELVKEKDGESRVESEISSRNNANEAYAFSAWLESRTRAANVQQLNRRP